MKFSRLPAEKIIYRTVRGKENMQRNAIKVSVIIPVYNGEKYICQCLDSVISQSLKDIEIICVDDGSSDSTPMLLEEYCKKDKRVCVITQENVNAGAARNAGLDIAQGEYLSFLDADDFFEKDMLLKAYNQASSLQCEIVVYRSNQYDEKKACFIECPWTVKEFCLPETKIFFT